MLDKIKNEFSYLDNVFEPIVIVNKKTEIEYYNNYFSTFLKTPPRLLKKAKSLNDLMTLDSQSIQDLISDCDKIDNIILSKEMKLTPNNVDDITYVVVIKVIPLSANYMLCFNDVSIEKMLHDKYRHQLQQLKDSHAQIVHADKLSTLGELTAGISHEINNPLTIASGSAEIIEILLAGHDLAPHKKQIEENLHNVSDALSRISDIISNMRSFLHKSEDKKEYCSLIEIIDSAIKMVEPSYKKAKVKIESKNDGSELVGFVNKIKIEQVLVNLLTNALDAVMENKTKNGKVIIGLNKDTVDECVNISVTDNGVGIKKEIFEDIFTPFYTTKDVGEGTGLGLSISSKIIEGHQGKLTFESPDGEGATFTVSLPLIEASSYSHNEKFLGGISQKEGKKILVVDDEVQILNVLSQFLDSDEYVFIGSTNGNDALKVLQDVNVDLIITDYNMPQMNGSEFSAKVRESNITCPIFYLTSVSNISRFQEDKKKYDVNGVILKPFTQDEVLKAIQGVFKE